ncbi:G2/mitotic-specific cyclin-B [Venturia canescens]|uniref:G2/mitotic-specific cyclin-B n=1 Tax=Venturia canescens TaxID=32260 RepID=UPI001C9C548C|nr:G2/mitotic-specific cyclin-B [Venturia canescens]
MALRNRTALTNIVNQENTKNVKTMTNGITNQPIRRAALGEIGNKVNTARVGEQTNKTKAVKKPILKSSSINTNVVVGKQTIQVSKPIAKKEQQPIVIKVELHEDEQIKKQPEAFSSDLLSIEDIDEIDRENPVLVSIYSNDIYNYLRQLEKQYPIPKGFLHGQEVTPKMRSVLVDWLVEVHQQFRLLQETLYLTIAIIDRFLSLYKLITRKRLQLVGVTALFIACKYEEMYSPDISDFVYISDNAYLKTEILQMEMLIIRTLDYSMGRPLPLHFLRRYSKAGRALPVHHTMAKYFLEESLVCYELSHYPPSLIAAAAIYLSFFVIGNDDADEGLVIWTNTMVHYSTYTKDDILPVVRDIASAVVNAEKSKYQAVRKKYTHAKHMKISLRPELKSPTMLSLVNVVKKE